MSDAQYQIGTYDGPEIPDRPEGWVMDYSDATNMTDYTGVQRGIPQEERDRKRWMELWTKFRMRTEECYHIFNEAADKVRRASL